MLRLEHLANLVAKHPGHENLRVREFALGGRHFAFNSRCHIMGVVNLSPDSWYRESVCLTAEAAIRRARVLHEQGADLIDIGAESTLAHAARVTGEQQFERMREIIGELARGGILTSIETYDEGVIRRSVEAGAGVINLTGMASGDSFKVIADHGSAVILCFVQGENVREVADLTLGSDPIESMRGYFERMIEKATRAGVTKILIDPGLGFYYPNLQDSSTRVRYQMNMFLNTFRLRALGYPVCHALPHAFETFGSDVRSAEPFFAVLAALGRTDLFRTHEVSRVRAVLETLEVW